MSEHNETLAEIVADMRTKYPPEPHCVHTVTGQYVHDEMTWLVDRIEAAAKRERGEMLDVIVRIGNWCAQDLAENAYTSDSSGNYLKTLNGLCEVCRPFMQKASKLKRYGGAE